MIRAVSTGIGEKESKQQGCHGNEREFSDLVRVAKRTCGKPLSSWIRVDRLSIEAFMGRWSAVDAVLGPKGS
ncbi:protein of unknown function [Methylocaldum szegediense]|uniref:Transposase n=1 Tax=Methylocaldum szegediense TaxID=73780 RepID=A0ABM9I103_9GAMM|nr:protein of unknown function [Methylocaldum szegediense]